MSQTPPSPAASPAVAAVAAPAGGMAPKAAAIAQARADFDGREWMEKIKADLQLRRRTTTLSRELIASYVGSYHGSQIGKDTWIPFAFEWCTLIVPQFIQYLPKVGITDGGIKDETTDALEQAMRSLMPSIKLERELRLVAFDMQFDYGVTMTRLAPTPGLRAAADITPMRPEIRRVSPRAYFRDCQSAQLGQPRHEGHQWFSQLDKLKEIKDANGEPKYDPEALARLSAGSVDDQVRQELVLDGIIVPAEDSKTVLLTTLYLAETDEILTLAWAGGELVRLRQVPAKTGEQSPYTLCELYPVPDHVYPLAPLAVTQKYVEAMNAHMRAAARAADGAKSLYLHDSDIPGISDVLANAPHNSLVGLKGLKRLPEKFETEGVRPEQLDWIQTLTERADRAVGLSDQARGVVKGEATATESALSGAFTDVRLKYSQGMFRGGTADALTKAVRMMDECQDVIFPLVARDPITGQSRRATFYGGQDLMSTRDVGSPWKRSCTVEIEPASMEYSSSVVLRQQMADAMDVVVGLVQAKKANPELNVENMLADYMATLNVPQAPGKYVDFAMLQQTLAIGMAMAGGPVPPQAVAGQQAGDPRQQPKRVGKTTVPAGAMRPGQQ